jgi:group II intron reverse transcriptase/maturase
MNIGEMQRTLSQKAEKDKNHRFDDLYSLICRMDWLRLAHDYIEQNAGSKTAGSDREDMDTFNADLEINLQALQKELQAETFDARAGRRVYIPKANGKMRPLGIPTIRDRIVQEAVRMILEPIYEADFSQYSFGFRPNRCTMDAIKCILWSTQESKKYFWVIEGDISSYFDTIDHGQLVNLLRHRLKDGKLLKLIWKFLRSGVMERGRYENTIIGTPQGGIISPLLANVYLHELDKYMADNYTNLPQAAKTARRAQGTGNYAYIRYADDFVVLCNGTRGQALAMREELRSFLDTHLCLSLSMEKTKVTHLNDGFDFLGFTVRRCMGQSHMGTKVLISDKSMSKHMEKIQVACAKDSYEHSVTTKIKALNRIIAGWCRYFQYTSKTADQFSKLEYETFWCFAHWLSRKHKAKMTAVMRKFRIANGLGLSDLWLIRHNSFASVTRTYAKRFLKPNPYTTQELIKREDPPTDNPWLGFETRPGMADLRQAVMERDKFTCRICKEPVTPDTCQVDHILPYRRYKRPVDANRLNNLWTLCIPCHKRKTESDRQAESRMQ